MELDLITGPQTTKPAKTGAINAATLPNVMVPKIAPFTDLLEAAPAAIPAPKVTGIEKIAAIQLPDMEKLASAGLPAFEMPEAEPSDLPQPLTSESQPITTEPRLLRAESDTLPEVAPPVSAPLPNQPVAETKMPIKLADVAPAPEPVVKAPVPEVAPPDKAPKLAFFQPTTPVPVIAMASPSISPPSTLPDNNPPVPSVLPTEPRTVQPASPQAQQISPAVFAPGTPAPAPASKLLEAGQLVISDEQTELPFNMRIDRQSIDIATIFHNPTRAHVAPPLAEQISTQLQQQLGKAEKQTIELRLDPPELGRVTIHMATHDQQMTAHISADRADTIDLMRRHADLLAATLEKAGFSHANLSFQQGNSQQNRQGFTTISAQGSAVETDAAAAPLSPLTGLDGRLDIRL